MAQKRHDRFLEECRPGDRIEVRKLVHGGVVWELATIEYIDRTTIVAILRDGARMPIRRSGLDVRPPRD